MAGAGAGFGAGAGASRLRRDKSVDLRTAGKRLAAVPATIEEERAASPERDRREQPRQEGNLALRCERSAGLGLGKARRRGGHRCRIAAARQIVLQLGKRDRDC